MGAVGYRARADLRARWRAWVAMGLLVGLAAGGSIGAIAGARRTSSAYSRYLAAQDAADVIMDVRDRRGMPIDVERLRALPGVEDVAGVVLVPVDLITPSGRPITFPDVFPITTRDGRFGRQLNRVKVLSGRHPDQDVVDEALVGFTVAERFDIRVGDTLGVRSVGTSSINLEEAIHDRVRIVGIGAMPGEFQPLAGANLPAIHLTRAFFERHATAIPPDDAFAVRFRDGPENLPALRRALERAGYESYAFFHQATQTEAVQRSNRFQAVALWLLGVLTALATAAVLGQALARQASLESDEFPVATVLGMTQGQLVSVGFARSALIAGVAGAVATGVAALLSPFTPVGLARIAEPAPGVTLDFTAVGIAVAGVAALVFGASAAVHWRAARLAGGVYTRSEALRVARPSRLAETFARVGATPSAVIGIRLALERGHGKRAVPVRSALMGVVLAVAAIVSAMGFGASMEHLRDSPELAGWTFDIAMDRRDVEAAPGIRSALEREGFIERWTQGSVMSLLLGGKEVVDGAIALPDGGPAPAIADGRAPAADNEIALGRETMLALGVTIGDEVAVQESLDPEAEQGLDGSVTSTPPMEMKVVGRVIMPNLGFSLGTAGQGATMTFDGWRRMRSRAETVQLASTPNSVFVELPNGVSPQVAADHIRDAFPDVFFSARRATTAADDASSLSSMPLVLAGILFVMAAATLAHALVTSIRRRARDIAIFQTLGFVHRQVRGALVWQATTLALAALLIGVPLGAAAGRWSWMLFAEELGVVPVAVTPAGRLMLVMVLIIAFAAGLAQASARIARRTQPAAVLRTE